MEFYEAYYAQERDTMPATIGVRLLKATEVHREECPASRYQEAMGRYRALAQEDGPLARYLWPQLKKGIEYLRKPGRGVPPTTSRVERAIREYRRRTKPMDGLKTDSGAENFNHLWMAKERAQKNGQDWLCEVMS